MAVLLPARGWWITLVPDPAALAQPFPGNLLEQGRRLTEEPFEFFVPADYDPMALAHEPRVQSVQKVWILTEGELQSLLGVSLPHEFSGRLLERGQERGLLYTDYDQALADLARVHAPLAHLLAVRDSGSEAARSLARSALAGDQQSLPPLADLLRQEGHPLEQAVRGASDPAASPSWAAVPRGPGGVAQVPPTPAVSPAPAPPASVAAVELKPVRTFAHGKTVPALAFSPDGTLLATACCDGFVRLWDRESGKVVRDWPLESLASAVAFSPDGTLLAGGNTEGDLFVWELPDGRERFFRHSWQGAFFSLAFAPDGGQIASANQRGSISLWDPVTGGDRGQLSGHRGRVWSVGFALRQGQVVLASGAEDGHVRLWDPASQNEIDHLPPCGDQVTCVAITPDGRWLAAAALEQGVRVWTLEGGNVTEHAPINSPSPTHAVAWAPGGERLALTDAAGVVHVWSLPWGETAGRLLGRFQAHTRPAHALAFAPGSDGGRWLVSAGEDGAAHLWDLGAL